MGDRMYYDVAPTSPVMEVIREAEQQQKMFHAGCTTLQREFPGTQVWTMNNSRIAGLSFMRDPPEGWRHAAGRDYAVPNRKTATGRRLAQRLAAMPQGVDAFKFSNMVSSKFGVSYTYMGEGAIMFTVYEKHGNRTLLNVPAGVKHVPPGCTELKMSEVWRIREQAAKRSGKKGEAGKKPKGCVPARCESE